MNWMMENIYLEVFKDPLSWFPGKKRREDGFKFSVPRLWFSVLVPCQYFVFKKIKKKDNIYYYSIQQTGKVHI